MKKSLVLAAAMALGVTASAYAANPFSDVPAGHWAYDSIDKLAAAGVIEGMGDGTYQGDRNMTRYEMAQIVAKAMAKGANVDKLAAEFADELDALGVRVAKLEKKSDNVQISGEFRAHYKKMKIANDDGHKYEQGLRTRLFVKGQINEDWTYNAQMQNEVAIHDGAADNKFDMRRANIEGRLFGFNVVAGKADYGWGDTNVMDDDLEPEIISLSYGNKLKVEGVYGNVNDEGIADHFYGAKVNFAPTDNFALNAEYVTFKDIEAKDSNQEAKIANVGLTYGMGDFELSGMYIHGKKDGYKGGKNGYVVGLSYKGADAEEPGSWGISANYYDQGQQTYMAQAIDGTTEWDIGNGFKGWRIGADWALAKNIVAQVNYYDTKAKAGSNEKDHVLWSAITFSF